MLTRTQPTFLLALALAGGARIASQAATVSYYTVPNLNVTVLDDGYDGSLSSMAASNLRVAAPAGATINSVRLDVRMDHTWVGDLVIKLRAPNNALITVLSRPGLIEPGDDGTSGNGDSSNILATFPIVYDDAANRPAETMGSSIGNDGVICRDDGICEFHPDPGAAMPNGNLGTLVGLNPTGTWTLFIGDSVATDLGLLQQWGLIMDITVPCSTDIVPPGGDGATNVSDLLAVIGTWGRCAGCPATHCPADVAPPPSGDCTINVSDLLLVIGHWGPCP